MITRQDVENDLNNIAFGVAQGDGLLAILDEIAVVCKNINELITEELKDAETTQEEKTSPEETKS